MADKKYEMGTGGGPVITTKVDDTDSKILNLISPKAIFGDVVAVPDVIFDFNFDYNLVSSPYLSKIICNVFISLLSSRPVMEAH